MTDTTTALGSYLGEVVPRLERLAASAADGALDAAVDILVDGLRAGGVLQAFGTGHSQAFVMEISGRAGGLIATSGIALRDVVVHGTRDASLLVGGLLERDASIVDELLELAPIGPDDVFLIASNSGVNGSIVGLALAVKERGHRVIAVTSIEHTNAVVPKHPSGKRLSEIADVVIDNLAPFGDTTLSIQGGPGVGIGLGAVSSITAAFIAQQLTIAVAERMSADGEVPPVYISANIPGGDEHNTALEERYAGRIRRGG